VIWVVQMGPQKFSAFHQPSTSGSFAPSRLGKRGVCAIVTKREAGCDGRGPRQKTNDVVRGRRSRVVLTPRRWCQVLEKQASQGRRWQTSPVTGESTKETVKTIAQGRPGDLGEPVVTNACAFYTTHAAAGATGTRLSLRPLFSRVILGKARADRAAGMRARADSRCPNFGCRALCDLSPCVTFLTVPGAAKAG
jgi:hypothetical protein